VLDISPFFQSFHFSSHENFFLVKKALHEWRIYALPSCIEIQSFSDCWEVAISPDEKQVVAHFSNFTYKVFDIESSGCRERNLCDKNALTNFLAPLEKNISIQNENMRKNEIYQNQKICSPNGNIRAEIDITNQLIVYNQKTNEIIFSLGSIANNSKVAFSKQGAFLAFLTPSKHLMAWNTKTKKLSKVFENISNFKFSLCDSIIFVTCNTTKNKGKTCIYQPEKTIFTPQSYKNTTQQNNIKNFFSGQKPKNVKYSDLNIFFNREKL